MNSITLKPKLIELHRLTEFILNKLPSENIHVILIVEEIFVNIASYAYGGGTGEAHLAFGFDEKERLMTLVVADEGVPFNPLEREEPDITLSAAERDIGGLGIFITRKTMFY